MEREALMSKPLISYLSSINDENRSGVWREGHESKTAENLPEYEEETKTLQHMCRLQPDTGWGQGAPKKWNCSGTLLAESQIFIQKNPEVTVQENITKS